jgi:hypothetical protein
MICDYQFVRKWAKIVTYCCAGGIAGLAISRFITFTNVSSPIQYIINIYLMYFINNFSRLLGILLAICEFEWEPIIKHFHFIKFFFGKAFYVVL